MAPYLPQLHSLTIDAQDEEDVLINDWYIAPCIGYCFTPQHTTHTLTHLTLARELERWLADLLAKHTPALNTLVVPCVYGAVVGEEYKPVQWAVQTLRLTQPDVAFPSSALMWMPTLKEGKMVIEVTDDVHVQLSLDSQVSSRTPAHKRHTHTHTHTHSKHIQRSRNRPPQPSTRLHQQCSETCTCAHCTPATYKVYETA